MVDKFTIRFKVRGDSNQRIFRIEDVPWQEKVSALKQRVKGRIHTRLEEESADDIKLYLDDPRDIERKMELEEPFSKNIDPEQIENVLIIVSIIKKKAE